MIAGALAATLSICRASILWLDIGMSNLDGHPSLLRNYISSLTDMFPQVEPGPPAVCASVGHSGEGPPPHRGRVLRADGSGGSGRHLPG